MPRRSIRIRRGRKAVQHRVEYALFRGMVFLCGRASMKTVRRTADVMGRLAFSVLRLRRSVTLANLAMAFPEKPAGELRRIGLRTYRNFARTFIEFLRFPVMDRDALMALCDFPGQAVLDEARRNGKGALLISGHFGNWEIVGPFLAAMGVAVSGIIGRQKNRAVDGATRRFREKLGMRVIRPGVAIREVYRALRSNECVAILADQDAHAGGIFVDFMGRKASNHQGPAVFSIRTGAPIIFGYGLRLPDGRYSIEAEPLRIDGIREATPENVHRITQAYTSLLEKTVREHPDQYFWMHKRWKTRPPEEKQFKV
ncbi:lysophospholipid acyltransferase family protein [bacterium]|nr:lysophospholipid acyltransferase family protein [bacterium]